VFRRPPPAFGAVLGAALATLLVAVATTVPVGPSAASVEQPDVVSGNPANYTPDIIDTGPGPKPRVDAIDQRRHTIYAGGVFNAVVDVDGRHYTRSHLMAFGATSGLLREYFRPRLNGYVSAVEATRDGIFVGGDFTKVNGVRRPALVKLDPATGAVVKAFDAGFRGGRVTEIDLVEGRLFVAGKVGQKLMALNPTTGRNTHYFDLHIADPIPGAWGAVAVYRFAIDPAGERLIATGNFRTVAGKPRSRLFVADLRPKGAVLDPWYYRPFAQSCSSKTPRRIAYLQGVDFSPGGRYFVVAATGQIPFSPDRGVTVCDAAARFNLDNDRRPVWINYTGGDSVWSVAATGAAVYVQGHFHWLDNRNGSRSECPPHDNCAPRKGIGAIGSVSGKALPWNPRKPAQIGGKDFYASRHGLWIGSDSLRIAGERRRGIAFMPLPGR